MCSLYVLDSPARTRYAPRRRALQDNSRMVSVKFAGDERPDGAARQRRVASAARSPNRKSPGRSRRAARPLSVRHLDAGWTAARRRRAAQAQWAPRGRSRRDVWRTTREASWSRQNFFYFFPRNPLKSPDSTKLNQIKPSKSKDFCLVLFGFACTRLAPWLNPRRRMGPGPRRWAATLQPRAAMSRADGSPIRPPDSNMRPRSGYGPAMAIRPMRKALSVADSALLPSANPAA